MVGLLIADPFHHSSSKMSDTTQTLQYWVGVERRIDGDHRRGRPVITIGQDDPAKCAFVERAAAKYRREMPWEG